MKIFLLLFVFLFNSSFALEKLKVIGDFNIATGEKFKETEIGGLSGLSYDTKTNHLLAISDDRSVINPARFYEFEVKVDEKSFSVKPIEVVTLKDSAGKTYEKHTIDFEGISLNGDNVFVSSEGSINRDNPIPPGVFKFSRDGKEVSKLEIPEKFLPNKDSFNKKTGPRDNLAFEALSSTPDGKVILVGMEESLLQDDSVTTPHHQSLTRIIRYIDQKPEKEILYQLEKVPSIPVAGLTVGETGLVDMAAIDSNSTYTLERAYMPLAKKTAIKIFKISNIDKAQDASKMDSIKNKDVKPIDKELVLNLDDILPSLSENFKSTDNIEGITFGPTLKNGHKTLIVVSDNNFSKNQRTQFIAFEIIP